MRNVGATGYTDVAVRDGINDGQIEGPRRSCSGPPLSITGGHCDNNLLPFEFHNKAEGVADGPWEARAKVREVIKYGADVIKVCASSGGVLSKGDEPGTPRVRLRWKSFGYRGGGSQAGTESGGACSRHAVHQGRHSRGD